MVTKKINKTVSKRIQDQPGYVVEKDPNLLRRISYLSELEGNPLGEELDKAIIEEDKALLKLGTKPVNILERNKTKAKPFAKTGHKPVKVTPKFYDKDIPKLPVNYKPFKPEPSISLDEFVAERRKRESGLSKTFTQDKMVAKQMIDWVLGAQKGKKVESTNNDEEEN